MVICIPTSIAMQHGSLSLSADEHGSAASLRNADSTSSVFQGVVPRFLHRRLSSFRDIAATYTRPSRHQRQSSNILCGEISPPPPYSEDPPSSDEDDMDAEFASAQSSRPTSSSATPTQPQLALSCDVQSQMIDDLVRFKFANQGLLLVAQSAQELRTNPNANNEYQRRLYLDGVAYLLRALPEELTDTERAGLQAALPAEIRESDKPQESITQPQDEPRQSAFRMVISVLVFWCFFAFATALPYMKFLARRLHEFERRHKLGEQCLNRTLSLVQITSAQLIAVLCAVWAYNDGIIGQKLADFGVWCAENVGDGVRDGLREAAAALRRSQDDK